MLTRRGVCVAALTTIGERPTRDTERGPGHGGCGHLANWRRDCS